MDFLFAKLPKDIKYLVLKQFPNDILYKFKGKGIQLIDDFFTIFCGHCYERKSIVNDNKYRACFNLDCCCWVNNIANSEIHDYCESCGKATQFHSDFRIAFYCEDCDLWWSYHEKFHSQGDELKRISRCKTKAVNIGWEKEKCDIILKEYSKEYNIMGKDEFDRYVSQPGIHYDYNGIFSFEQGDLLLFECKDCKEIYGVDPIGS